MQFPNYPKQLFDQFKKNVYPMTSGEDEKRLRVAFMNGMCAGREITIQSMKLDDRTCVEFNTRFGGDIKGAIREMGMDAPKIQVFGVKAPIIPVKAKINGENIN